MSRFGLIGQPLTHSWSPDYFADLFRREGIEAQYRLYPLKTIDEVRPLLDQLQGFNVTIPYKQSILPYLSDLDPIAREIGAVNVVCQRRGYNTDWLGFMRSIQSWQLTDTQALILGSGGVSQAVQYALRQMAIPYRVVSRTAQGALRYEDLTPDIILQHTLIVNCTPLGMFPHIDTCPPIPYEYLTPKHKLMDCVYNPEETLFLQRGRAQGTQTQNGVEMLHLQAEETWKIWQHLYKE